jgi:hypothetical protein
LFSHYHHCVCRKKQQKGKQKKESDDVSKEVQFATSALRKAISVAGVNLLAPLHNTTDDIEWLSMRVESIDTIDDGIATMRIALDGTQSIEFANVAVAHNHDDAGAKRATFVATAATDQAVAEMLVDHACGRDVLLIGPPGLIVESRVCDF